MESRGRIEDITDPATLFQLWFSETALQQDVVGILNQSAVWNFLLLIKTTIHKLANIQRRAIKWILSEEGPDYNDLEYTKRLKDLDLFP